MSDDVSKVELGVCAYRFGGVIYDGDQGLVIADAGDVMLSITKDGESTFATMTPDIALSLAENLITAANRGMDLIKEHEADQVQ